VGVWKIAEYYQSDLEYLMDELIRLDLMLLHLRAAKTAGHKGAEDPFSGFYVSDSEAEALLEDQNSLLLIKSKSTDYSDRMLSKELEIQQKILKSMEMDTEPRLFRLARTFNLNKLEMDTIIVCAAIELDPKYERLYGYLQDDLTRKYPTSGLIQELLCNTREDIIAARRFFLPDSKLFRNKIIELANSREEFHQIAPALRLNPNILGYIMGEDDRAGKVDGINDELDGLSDFSEDKSDIFESGRIPAEIIPKLKNLIGHLEREGCSGICILEGPYGSGKSTVADAICHFAGLGIIKIDLLPMVADSAFDINNALSWPLQKAMLDCSAVYISGLDLLPAADPRSLQLKAVLEKEISNFSGLAILSCLKPVEVGRAIQRKAFMIDMPIPDFPDRKRMWLEELGDRMAAKDIDALATKFVFTAGQIGDAIITAQNIAVLDGRDVLQTEDLYRGSRDQASRKLSTLSTRIKTEHQSAELILPEDKMMQLCEIKSFIRNKGAVYYEWGFGRKLSLGKGLNVLFSGSSGTGKTLAAGILAKELGLEIYKVDLSTIMSKYIGETEMNLNKIFKEAREINAILFFDEADAIFGKRSEVKDSHDRYANIEISYLLQKMEEHEGIVIMATNFCKNMDDAFVRRMQFIVEFPFPDAVIRQRIWKSLIPAEAPLAGDVDIEFLASRFKFSGGNIKNILMSAAFMAADSSGIISMEHIVKSTIKEHRKIGLICSQNDFGKYYPLAKDKS
jgi:SpoVK/Ycf46/Vps4 family AAA+-type ATPase